MKVIFSVLSAAVIYISPAVFTTGHANTPELDTLTVRGIPDVQNVSPQKDGITKAATTLLRKQILAEAAWAMTQKPVTITDASSPRSAGGKHDFFSEADYFWPDPQNPDGPYINRDGLTNPDNFVEHRKAMIRLSKVIGALASAYKLTDRKSVV